MVFFPNSAHERAFRGASPNIRLRIKRTSRDIFGFNKWLLQARPEKYFCCRRDLHCKRTKTKVVHRPIQLCSIHAIVFKKSSGFLKSSRPHSVNARIDQEEYQSRNI